MLEGILWMVGIIGFLALVIFLDAYETPKAKAARLEEEALERILYRTPFLVVGVNGETALVEHWDGHRFTSKNPFPNLEQGQLCELTWNGSGIIDYIPWRWM